MDKYVLLELIIEIVSRDLISGCFLLHGPSAVKS